MVTAIKNHIEGDEWDWFWNIIIDNIFWGLHKYISMFYVKQTQAITSVSSCFIGNYQRQRGIAPSIHQNNDMSKTKNVFHCLLIIVTVLLLI